MRILIVDDELLIAQGIQHIIRKMDVLFDAVDVALSGEAALKMMEETRYELLLTDINMPNMNGLELIEQVMQRKLCSYFCILSGYSDFEYARSAFRLGVVDYLLKPIDKEELRKVLAHFTDRYMENVKNESWSLHHQISDCIFGDIPMEFSSMIFSESIYLAVYGNFSEGDSGDRADIIRKRIEEEEVCQFIIPILKLSAYVVIGKETQLRDFLQKIQPELSDFSVGYMVGKIDNNNSLYTLFTNAMEAVLYADLLLSAPVLDYRQMKPLNTDNVEEIKNIISMKYETDVPADKVISYQFWRNSLIGKISGFVTEDDYKNEYVRKIIKIIRDEYRKELTLNDVSRMINLNPDYTGKIFKAEVGMNFPEYLNRYRIMQILNIIRQNPRLSFEQVVPDIGFPNVRSFYRVFKKIMQMTPGEYRDRVLDINK